MTLIYPLRHNSKLLWHLTFTSRTEILPPVCMSEYSSAPFNHTRHFFLSSKGHIFPLKFAESLHVQDKTSQSAKQEKPFKS